MLGYQILYFIVNTFKQHYYSVQDFPLVEVKMWINVILIRIKTSSWIIHTYILHNHAPLKYVHQPRKTFRLPKIYLRTSVVYRELITRTEKAWSFLDFHLTHQWKKVNHLSKAPGALYRNCETWKASPMMLFYLHVMGLYTSIHQESGLVAIEKVLQSISADL